MIKLKDILAESTKIELHKVVTDKTEPAFMTEEEWQKKWAKDTTLNEGKVNDYLKRTVLHFLNGSFKFNKPQDDKTIALMTKYVYTGKISNSEAKILRKFFEVQLPFGGLAIGTFLIAIIGLLPAAFIALFIGILIKKYGVDWISPSADNNYITKSQAAQYKRLDDKDWSKKALNLASKASRKVEMKIYKTLDKKGYQAIVGKK